MTNIDKYLNSLATEGYCIIEKAFTEEYCDQALQAMHRVERNHNICASEQEFSGRKTVRIMNLLQYDDLFQQVPLHETSVAVLEKFLDEEFLLSGIDSSEIHPGEGAQAIHTDTWWHDDYRFNYPVSANTVLTLCDFTEENGATRIVPGSHLWSAEEVSYSTTDTSSVTKNLPGKHVDGYGTKWNPIVLSAPKGSLIMFDCRILHGAGPNMSDKPRPSIVSPYVRGWLRQLDNFAYGLTHEKMRSFSPRLQAMIGLERFRGGYSSVNNMSPREWLWDRKAQQAAI